MVSANVIFMRRTNVVNVNISIYIKAVIIKFNVTEESGIFNLEQPKF